MIFAMLQAFSRMNLNRRKTLVQACQLILSFFLLSCFINIFSSSYNLAKREDLADTTFMRLSWTQPHGENYYRNGYSGFSLEDYQLVQQTASDVNMIYASWCAALTNPLFRTVDAPEVEVYIAFAPREQIATLGEALPDPRAKLAISHISSFGLPKEIYAAIEKAVANNDFSFLKANHVARNMIRNGYASEDITATTLYAIPIEYISSIPDDTLISIYLATQNGNESVTDVLKMLYRQHPHDIEYYALPMNSGVMTSIDRANDQARDFMMYALIIMVAVFAGLIGYILMQWSQRRNEYAILMCLGVSYHVLFFESTMEIIALFVISCIIGSSFSAVLSPNIVIGEVTVTSSIWAFVIPLVVATCMISILAMVNLNQMKRIDLSSTLRD